MAADRGIQVAGQTGDLTLIGSAARRGAHALSATHQSPDAVHLVRSAADRLEPHLATADPAFTSAYGMLLLKGSIAAARLHQEADVRDLQDEALSVAEGYQPHRPHQGSKYLSEYPWHVALDCVESAMT